MKVRQLQATYCAEDDRILLRLSADEEDGTRQELRCWLTRRLIKILWPTIMSAMQKQVVLDLPQAAHASSEIVSMEHHASVSKIKAGGNFDVPFDTTAASYPKGTQPLLCTVARIHLELNKGPRINFESAHDGGFEVQFDSTLLHGLCTMLQQVVKSAEWGIELQLPGGAQVQESAQGMH